MNKLIVLFIGIPVMGVWMTRHSLHRDTRFVVPKPIHVESPSAILTIVHCEGCGKTFRLRSEKSQK